MKLELLLAGSGNHTWYLGNGLGQPAASTFDHTIVGNHRLDHLGDGIGGKADCDDIERIFKPFTFEYLVTNAALQITWRPK